LKISQGITNLTISWKDKESQRQAVKSTSRFQVLNYKITESRCEDDLPSNVQGPIRCARTLENSPWKIKRIILVSSLISRLRVALGIYVLSCLDSEETTEFFLLSQKLLNLALLMKWILSYWHATEFLML
jgi:hypothetical protein